MGCPLGDDVSTYASEEGKQRTCLQNKKWADVTNFPISCHPYEGILIVTEDLAG